MRKILTIAPAHFIYDERVVRTVAATGRFTTSYYAIDRAFHRQLGEKRDTIVADVVARLPANVEIKILPPWPLMRGLSRITRHIFVVRVALQAKSLKPDVVHIHESGILGLMIAFWVRRFLPGARIIYDYHDWIPSELASATRYVPALYATADAVLMPYLRTLAKAVDVAVCISPGQAEWVSDTLGIQRTVVVQNVRPPRPAPPLPAGGFTPRLLFAGNVMRIRRLEFIVDILARLREHGFDADLAICGDLTEPDYVEEIRAYSSDRGVGSQVTFHGRYQGDEGLVPFVSQGTVGVTMALAEPIDTGVNAIASANKLFSYFALGVPVLIEASYKNMVEITTRADAGAAFTTVDDCVTAIRAMWTSPDEWLRLRENALRLAATFNSEYYTTLFGELYDTALLRADTVRGAA